MNKIMQETKINVNHETGEVKETTTTSSYKAESEPNYIKLYLADISYLNQLPKGTDAIIFELLKYINYEQQIVINAHLKRNIAEKINRSVDLINKSITNLTKRDVLIRVGRGTYEINSYIFGKGSWKDILKHRQSLEIKISYSKEEGRTIETTMEKIESNRPKSFFAQNIKQA